MNVTIGRRTLVRIIAFTLALFLVLGGVVWYERSVAADYRRQLSNSYVRSLGELSGYLVNISDDLQKGQYIGTSGQLAQVSARIWRESGSAKSALSALPVTELHLDNTYKFLSQTGDYAMFLSKKVASGETLTENELHNAEALREYSSRLTEYVDELQRKIRVGQIRVNALPSGGDATGGTHAKGLAEGFEAVEQTMTGYPTLIYDGPFSDHLLTQRPKYTRGLPLVTAKDAQQTAAKAAMLLAKDLYQTDDENSNMPCYTFAGGEISAAVTKAGGQVAYMVNARTVADERIKRDMAFENAQSYLARLGISDMRATYFEIADGICTINYAAMEGDVTLYPDLVKVGIALDDGGVVFYDARGYLTNHHRRDLAEPALAAQDAMTSVSEHLTIHSTRLALIPTSGGGEVLCHEFLAGALEDGAEQKVLVYVNAQTGAEEQILLLIETPYGTLTK